MRRSIPAQNTVLRHCQQFGGELGVLIEFTNSCHKTLCKVCVDRIHLIGSVQGDEALNNSDLVLRLLLLLLDSSLP